MFALVFGMETGRSKQPLILNRQEREALVRAARSARRRAGTQAASLVLGQREDREALAQVGFHPVGEFGRNLAPVRQDFIGPELGEIGGALL